MRCSAKGSAPARNLKIVRDQMRAAAECASTSVHEERFTRRSVMHGSMIDDSLEPPTEVSLFR